MVAAMGPPGGGRNAVTHRFLRHFNVIGIDSFSEDTMKNIFGPILDWQFSKGFDNNLRKFSRVNNMIVILKRLFSELYVC